jgi:dTDP-glucose pyrophosphorylase
MHAIILAGGKGVRLRPYTTRLPKPLVPIAKTLRPWHKVPDHTGGGSGT